MGRTCGGAPWVIPRHPAARGRGGLRWLGLTPCALPYAPFSLCPLADCPPQESARWLHHTIIYAAAPWGRVVAAAPPVMLRGVESFRAAARLYVVRRLRSRPMGAGRSDAAHRQRGPPPRWRSLGGSPAPSRSAPLPTVAPRQGRRGYGRAVSPPTGAAFLSAPPPNTLAPRLSPVRKGFWGAPA